MRSCDPYAKRRWRSSASALAAFVLVAVTTGAAIALQSRTRPLLLVHFNGPDRVVTNERAQVSRGAPVYVTSGSLFVRNGNGWPGIPDANRPDAASNNATNSAIFRLLTTRADFKNVSVSFLLRNLGLSETGKTPQRSWDGVHIFLRYRSQFELYSVSVNRRDGLVAIKKKQPGGSANGGTYYDLASVRRLVPYGRWQQVNARVANTAQGEVVVSVSIDGRLLATATDNGRYGRPLTDAGRVSIRGDNCNFFFNDLVVRAASA